MLIMDDPQEYPLNIFVIVGNKKPPAKLNIVRGGLVLVCIEFIEKLAFPSSTQTASIQNKK